MRKLILRMLTSIDGFIADPQGARASSRGLALHEEDVEPVVKAA